MKKVKLSILLLYSLFCLLGTYASDVDAYALRQEALSDFDQGKAADAQSKLIKAYVLFTADNNWDMASMCLYERAIDYMNIGDLENMSAQKETLKLLFVEHESAIVAYNFHSVASAYYSYVDDSINLAIEHGWGAINALDKIDNLNDYNIVPVWSYYNLALFYDMYFTPPQTDSVLYYLHKSREVLKVSRTRKDSLEGLISVMDLEAWQEYYKKDYAKAEHIMMSVLRLVDTVALVTPSTIVTERGEAYKFLAMINEEQCQWRKAFGFQQKLLENNEIRYGIDKRRVLQEVQTQYEVEKQQLEMDKLTAENKLNRWVMIALCLLLLAFVLGCCLLAISRKHVESKLYEAALESDNMRQMIRQFEDNTDIDPLVIMVDELVTQLQGGAKREYVERTIAQLRDLDLKHLQLMLAHGKKITTMDKRYILCFAAGMSVDEIADFMCLEPASVYTVRYRLRKKFDTNYPFCY